MHKFEPRSQRFYYTFLFFQKKMCDLYIKLFRLFSFWESFSVHIYICKQMAFNYFKAVEFFSRTQSEKWSGIMWFRKKILQGFVLVYIRFEYFFFSSSTWPWRNIHHENFIYIYFEIFETKVHFHKFAMIREVFFSIYEIVNSYNLFLY